MKREGLVYRNGVLVGELICHAPNHYTFQYDQAYLARPEAPAISLTLPKRQDAFEADHLFPFFFNLLAEGANRRLQCRQLQIDEADHFSLLLATAHTDTIGPVVVLPKLVSS